MSEPDVQAQMRALLALADPERIRVLALIADRGLTAAEIAASLVLEPHVVTSHLTVLGQAGLITTAKSGHERRVRLQADRLAEIQAVCQARLAEYAVAETDTSIPAEIRQFFRDGRLTSFPSKQSRYLEILAVLVSDFTPETNYPEAEVNAILFRRHEDFATLRRDLVDFGFMTRAGGIYRRIR